MLQPSVAVAVPRAASIVGGFGLPQINKVVPVAVMVGAVASTVHETERVAVDVLPHPSVAIHDLVCEREQPLLVMLPSLTVTVGVPHASVTVAFPRAASICAVLGLQEIVAPVTVIVGGVKSTVHVAVLDVVDVFPQPSVAVNILVWLLLQAFD